MGEFKGVQKKFGDYLVSGYLIICSMTVGLFNTKMPEASNSNVHGFIHGSYAGATFNTRGVEDHQINK
jgi:hypothetical protein